MKKCLLLLVATIVLFFTVTSCVSNSPRAIIQAEVAGANRICPQNMGGGLTLINLEFPGRYVVYNFKGTEDMIFMQDKVTPEMKNNIIETLRSQAQYDKSVERFISALKKEGIGIIYHYYNGQSSVMDVVIEARDL